MLRRPSAPVRSASPGRNADRECIDKMTAKVKSAPIGVQLENQCHHPSHLEGIVMKRISSLSFFISLIAVLGHVTAGRAEAQLGQPTHQAILAAIDSVQSTVNDIDTGVVNIPPVWNQKLPTAERFVPGPRRGRSVGQRDRAGMGALTSSKCRRGVV